LLLLALAGCGDDDDTGSNPDVPDAGMHTGSGGASSGTGGSSSGTGGNTQPGTGGHGAGHDAGAQADAGSEPDAGFEADAAAPKPCSIDARDPRLPGVTLHVESDRCQIPFGEGQHFTWKLELDQSIDYTTMDSSGACGRCGAENDSDAVELVDYAIEGNSQRYCVCDVGCCPPTTAHAAQLAAGSSSHDIDWPGRQWNGPSDTSQPYGDFFPVGHYAVDVTFAVPGVGTLKAALPIEVVPRAAGSTSCPDGTTYGKSCMQCGPTDACERDIEGCFPKCTEQTADCATHGGGVCIGGACRMVCG
jgi:hypothetical protein